MLKRRPAGRWSVGALAVWVVRRLLLVAAAVTGLVGAILGGAVLVGVLAVCLVLCKLRVVVNF